MAPSRFGNISSYRNSLLTALNPPDRYEELSSCSNPSSLTPSICSSLTHLISTNSNPSNLTYLKHSNKGKFSNQPPNFHAINGNISDFKVSDLIHSSFNSQLLAVANQSSNINIFRINDQIQFKSQEVEGEEEDSPTLISSIDLSTSISSSISISSLAWHPNSQDLLLVSSSNHTGNAVEIWDISMEAPISSIQLHTESPALVASWSMDGKYVLASCKDGKLRIWDPRKDVKPLVTFQPHQSKLKPSLSIFVKSSHILTTGFGAQREREFSVWELSTLLSSSSSTPTPIHTNKLDVSTSVLLPQVDQDRGLCFFLSKGDSILRWLEINTTTSKPVFTEGSFPLITSAQSFCLMPTNVLEVMKTEIGRIVVLSQDGKSLIPYGLNVPRRQYIDFHRDLFPDTRSFYGKLRGGDWLKGEEGERDLVGMDEGSLKERERKRREGGGEALASEVDKIDIAPALASEQKKEIEKSVDEVREKESEAESQETVKISSSSSSQTAIPSAAPTSNTNGSPRENLASTVQQTPPPTQAQTQAATPITQPKISTPIPISNSNSSQPSISKPSTTSSNPPIPSNSTFYSSSSPPQTSYSRRFLNGVSSLLPTHSSLPNLDISLPPSSRLITCTTSYFFYPLSGPGGRIAYHPFSKTGRMPEGNEISNLEGDSKVVDFVGDLLRDSDGIERIWIARENGKVENWELKPFGSEDELEKLKEIGSKEPKKVLVFKGGKISELLPHPNAKGLVAILPAENDGKITIWNSLEDGEETLDVELPKEKGIHSGAWSPDGKFLALTGKDGVVRVINPRGKNEGIAEIKGHSSPRPNRLLWLSSTSLLSVGHDKFSSRQLLLFSFDPSNINLKELSSLQLDNSPSILFPHFDPLTSILFLHSKGARTISSYEVRPGHANPSQINSTPNVGGGSRFGTSLKKEVWTALPNYQGNEPQLGLAFKSRRSINVKDVEIATSLRISRGEARVISWRISRNRPEFFQDDIFLPMLADDVPLLSASAWLSGKDGEDGEILDLKPADMGLLSTAPAVVTKSLPKGPIEREMTEKEREDALLNGVFQSAKGVNDRKAMEDKEMGIGITGKYGEEARSRVPDSGDWSDED